MTQACEQLQAAWVRGADGEVRLLASLEIESGKHFFPPMPKSSPLVAKYRTVELSSKALLYSYTIIHPNPKTGKKPFVLIYADFPEDVRVFGKLLLALGDTPRIGDPLRVALELEPEGGLNYAFIPEG